MQRGLPPHKSSAAAEAQRLGLKIARGLHFGQCAATKIEWLWHGNSKTPLHYMHSLWGGSAASGRATAAPWARTSVRSLSSSLSGV